MIAQNYEKFIEGSLANGFAKKDAEDVWNLMEKFAGYGFNKSHSTAYALIAYQTAYLKSHYSVEFMAALLSGDIPGRNFKKKDSLVEHLEDCARMNIEVVPPDVNQSDVDFSVVGNKIHFALSAVKGCGGGAGDSIEAERKKNGKFRDLFDFCERVDASHCNRATIETLIKAGAFDSFGARRSQLLAVLERAIQSGVAALADRRSGQRSLFGDIEEETVATPQLALPDIPELDEREKLNMEKEVLGFYLTSHPLAEHAAAFATFCSHTSADLADLPDRTEVTIGGMIASIKLAHVRKVRPGVTATKYANFDLEDVHGAVRCILWPDDFAVCGEMVQADAILAVRGVIDRRGGGDEINFIVNELIPIDQLGARYTRGIALRMHEDTHGERTLQQLREILRGYPGECEVQLILCLADGARVQLRAGNVKVEVNAELRRRVDELLGPSNVRLLTNQGDKRKRSSSAPAAAGGGRQRSHSGSAAG